MTYTPTNILQYNACLPELKRRQEYYAFGLQTQNSWTRAGSDNDYLYNAGSELNSTTQHYEMHYRDYDPVLGRMNAIDPMASKYASLTPYNYAFNDPVTFNDPNGADPLYTETTRLMFGAEMRGGRIMDGSGMSGSTGGRGSVTSFFSDGWSPSSNSLVSGPRIYSPWGGADYGNGKYGGEWIPLNSYEGQTLFDNQFGIDSRVVIDEQDKGECPPGVNCDGWKFQKTDENGSKWYNVPSKDHHIGGLVEVTRDGKIIHHDVYGKNMSEGIVRTFKEAFPIFKDPEKAEVGEDIFGNIIESIIEGWNSKGIPVWKFPLPFFIPPDAPPLDGPGPMIKHPKLGPR